MEWYEKAEQERLTGLALNALWEAECDWRSAPSGLLMMGIYTGMVRATRLLVYGEMVDNEWAKNRFRQLYEEFGWDDPVKEGKRRRDARFAGSKMTLEGLKKRLTSEEE